MLLEVGDGGGNICGVIEPEQANIVRLVLLRLEKKKVIMAVDIP